MRQICAFRLIDAAFPDRDIGDGALTGETGSRLNTGAAHATVTDKDPASAPLVCDWEGEAGMSGARRPAVMGLN